MSCLIINFYFCIYLFLYLFMYYLCIYLCNYLLIESFIYLFLYLFLYIFIHLFTYIISFFVLHRIARYATYQVKIQLQQLVFMHSPYRKIPQNIYVYILYGPYARSRVYLQWEQSCPSICTQCTSKHKQVHATVTPFTHMHGHRFPGMGFYSTVVQRHTIEYQADLDIV